MCLKDDIIGFIRGCNVDDADRIADSFVRFW